MKKRKLIDDQISCQLYDPFYVKLSILLYITFYKIQEHIKDA